MAVRASQGFLIFLAPKASEGKGGVVFICMHQAIAKAQAIETANHLATLVGGEDTANPDLARAILRATRDLNGYWVDVLKEGAESFEDGTDTEPEFDALVLIAFRTRLLVDVAACRLATNGQPSESFTFLGRAVHEADDKLAPHYGALSLIPEADYQAAIKGNEVFVEINNEWWGARHRLDEAYPKAEFERVLEEIRKNPPLRLV